MGDEPLSLREQLRASRKAAQNRQTQEFPIPGYNPPLWGTFKALDDYSEARAIVLAHKDIPDDAERELLIAADTLAASCTHLYVVVGDQRGELDGLEPQGFTPAVAEYLVIDETAPDGEDGGLVVENDRQAVLAIFPNTLALMTSFGEIDRWFKRAGVASDEQVSGNSLAPS